MFERISIIVRWPLKMENLSFFLGFFVSFLARKKLKPGGVLEKELYKSF
jgi:hypothetical protein